MSSAAGAIQVKVCVAPLSIRLDYRPEFIVNSLLQWAQSKGIVLNHTDLARGRVFAMRRKCCLQNYIYCKALTYKYTVFLYNFSF